MDSIVLSKRLTTTNIEAFELPWDTNFFKTPSARAILKGSVMKDELNMLEEFLQDYSFATIMNKGNNKHNNYFLGLNTRAFLTDMNIQFIKDVNKSEDIQNVKVQNMYPFDFNILKLCEGSFFYSRFFNDPNLDSEKSKNIYTHWATSSFLKEDKYFVVAEDEKSVSGFLLYSLDRENSEATIELIAVDKNCRGKNIGNALIRKMEYALGIQNIKSIKVGTQVDNDVAIRFYNSNGFKYKECSSIYHYWPNIV